MFRVMMKWVARLLGLIGTSTAMVVSALVSPVCLLQIQVELEIAVFVLMLYSTLFTSWSIVAAL